MANFIYCYFFYFFFYIKNSSLDFSVRACVTLLLKHLIEFALFDSRRELDYRGYKRIKLRHS